MDEFAVANCAVDSGEVRTILYSNVPGWYNGIHPIIKEGLLLDSILGVSLMESGNKLISENKYNICPKYNQLSISAIVSLNL